MDIVINTDISKIFKQYLTIFNSILSTRKLTSMEIEVVSKLLHINYLYKHLPKEDRDKILFHKETKERIRKSLNNLSKHSYNNILSSLRKKNLISKQELLISAPVINNQINLNFKLQLTQPNV